MAVANMLESLLAGSTGGEPQLEDHRVASVPAGDRVRAAVDGGAGAVQHRVDQPAVRPGRHGRRAGLAGGADRGGRRRPGRNNVVKDPDEQVQAAVTDLFAEFHRTGSALGVVRAFAETGRLFPQRAWGGAWAGKLKWGKLTHARVLQVLKNPTYAGVYTFGKTRDVRRVQPDGSVRTSRRKRAREEWTVLIEDHHEGYLTWQEYLVIEAKLAANNTQKRARPVREGTALCQGIIFCGVCGGRVATRYDRRDRKVSYRCPDSDSARTAQCRTFDASTVDSPGRHRPGAKHRPVAARGGVGDTDRRRLRPAYRLWRPPARPVSSSARTSR